MTKPKTSNKSSTTKPTGKLPREPRHVPAVAAVAAASPQSVDEASGRAALTRIMPLVVAIPASEVVALTLNLRVAALTVLGVYGLIESHGLRPRLEAQARLGELDIEQLDRLADLARATFYIRLKVEQVSAVASEAMVPAALATHGQETRRRMLKLLDFHFEDDPAVAPKLSFIRRGTGYQDLAEDLLGLAELYREHKETLKQSTSHYRAGDDKDAANTAAELMAWLGGDAAGGGTSSEQLSYSEQASRAGLLMVRAYDEVAEVARYLCRRNAALAARFQSLYALTRPRGTAAAGEAPAPTDSAPKRSGHRWRAADGLEGSATSSAFYWPRCRASFDGEDLFLVARSTSIGNSWGMSLPANSPKPKRARRKGAKPPRKPDELPFGEALVVVGEEMRAKGAIFNKSLEDILAELN